MVAQANSKAFYVIFRGVDIEQFKMISTYKTAKEAWTILQNQHKENATVRMSKLQISTTSITVVHTPVQTACENPEKLDCSIVTLEDAYCASNE
ncbi:hypothetical protein PVK06_021478 [Gossypium arboreum]|uniref:Uncharacterized protein n=1 Tax=Gossypium arboreum TaxID=29729 RepID=A0ABR0PQN3_GOSAR|nr:hypothetical protein PVK06_021478 [Gossypium arboreum]